MKGKIGVSTIPKVVAAAVAVAAAQLLNAKSRSKGARAAAGGSS